VGGKAPAGLHRAVSCATPRAVLRRAALLDMFAAFRLIPIQFADIEYGDALLLAESAGLSFRDGAYLWLARQLDAELVTLDKRLHDAWSATRQAR
jgi:predicted nucleic acid-binding protein